MTLEPSGPAVQLTDDDLNDEVKAEIRAILARILASDAFRKSYQLQALLTYLVDKALNGQADKLKGYTIGIEALKRPPDFDPQIDPIVRVEAARLRRALVGYYNGEGASAAYEIRIDKGGYAPVFVQKDVPQSLPPEQTTQTARPRAFQFGLAALAGAAAMFVLTQFIDLGIGIATRPQPFVSPSSATSTATANNPPREVEPYRPLVNVVSGDNAPSSLSLASSLSTKLLPFELLRVLDPSGDLRAQLAAASPWAKRYEVKIGRCEGCADESLAFFVTLFPEQELVGTGTVPISQIGREAGLNKIAKLIASDTGFIRSNLRRLSASNWTPFSCVGSITDYFFSYDEAIRQRLLRCADEYENSGLDDVFSEIVVAYMALDKVWRGENVAFNLAKADRASQRVLELRPDSAQVLYLRSLVHSAKGNGDLALASGRKAAELNPLDDVAQAGLGARYLRRGEFAKARDILEPHLDAHAIGPAWLSFNLGVAYILLGETEKAANVASLLRASSSAFGMIVQVISESRDPSSGAAGRALATFRRVHPSISGNVRSVVMGYYSNTMVGGRIADLYDAAVTAIDAAHPRSVGAAQPVPVTGETPSASP